MVRGHPKHVAAYAKDFLFRDSQLRQPVSTLSGGERNRLLLARALAKPANLLVLDEPTNDLDMETLDLLEDLLADYDGTLILVSHDRDFIDRLATSTIALDGRGGRWRRRAAGATSCARTPASSTPPGTAGGQAKRRRRRRPPAAKRDCRRPSSPTRTQRRLEELEALIARAARRDRRGGAALARPRRSTPAIPQGFDRLMAALDAKRAELAAAEEEWLALEEKREALAG